MDNCIDPNTNFDHMLRFCGGNWVYCDGKCNECTPMKSSFSTHTTLEDTHPNHN